ncbi:hypothetical protein [Singulisphaera sp. PoT]|uniref:hypothetical protein n=1 Tax=Singulisphaera sp. PoT TaxID=3411797 RepID=UPI003BF5EDE7
MVTREASYALSVLLALILWLLIGMISQRGGWSSQLCGFEPFDLQFEFQELGLRFQEAREFIHFGLGQLASPGFFLELGQWVQGIVGGGAVAAEDDQDPIPDAWLEANLFEADSNDDVKRYIF